MSRTRGGPWAWVLPAALLALSAPGPLAAQKMYYSGSPATLPLRGNATPPAEAIIARADEGGCMGKQTVSTLSYWGTTPGDYGQWKKCEKTPGFHYCVVQYMLANYSLVNPKQLKDVTQMGACVPDSCTAPDLTNDTNIWEGLAGALEHKYLPKPVRGFYFWYAICGNNVPKFEGVAVGVAVIFLILIFSALVGTLLDAWEKSQIVTETSHLMIQEGQTAPDARPKKPRYPFVLAGFAHYFRAFSLSHNWSRLIVPVPGNTASLNGMRVLSMGWIILGHTMYIGEEVIGYRSSAEFFHIATSWDYLFIVPAAFAVDSFFWLSGFLATFMLTKTLMKMDQKEAKKIEEGGNAPSLGRKVGFWTIFVVHRYYRLTPVYAMLLFTWYKLVPLMGSGPAWYRIVIGCTKNCNTYWWTNLLYINNLHPSQLLQECMGWSWYLANDMQFYLCAPFIIRLWIYKKSHGTLLCLILLVASYISNAFVSAHDISQHAINDFTGQPYNTYVKPYVRIPPYLFGVLSAFFLHHVAPNGVESFRRDEHEANSVSQKWCSFFKRDLYRRLVYFTAFCLLFATMLLDWKLIRDHNRGNSWSEVAVVIETVYVRFSWGMGLSLIWVPWVLGWGGMANKFLSHSIWTAPARLTFTAYLAHPILMSLYFGMLENSPWFSRQSVMYLFAAFFTSAYTVAMAMYMLVEKPLMNLEKFILPTH